MFEKFISHFTPAGINRYLDKKKIIQILFISAILLLIGNLITGKLIPEVKSGVKNEISLLAVDNKFKASLLMLGLDETLLKPKKKKQDEDSKHYRITIPNDLSIPLIIIELENEFADDNVEIVSEEKIIGGKTIFKITQQNKVLLNAEMDYEKSLLRTGGFIAFVLEGFDELDGQTISVLLRAPELFGILLTPSKKNIKFADSLTNYRKEIVVLLDDGIEELDFKLSESYSQKRLKNSISSVVSGFKKAVCFLIDENSELHNSTVKPLLTKEFKARKISFFNKKMMVMPEGDKIQDKKRAFRKILDEAKDNKSRVILLEAEHFLTFLPEIVMYRKIGYKFVNPSEILSDLME